MATNTRDTGRASGATRTHTRPPGRPVLLALVLLVSRVCAAGLLHTLVFPTADRSLFAVAVEGSAYELLVTGGFDYDRRELGVAAARQTRWFGQVDGAGWSHLGFDNKGKFGADVDGHGRVVGSFTKGEHGSGIMLVEARGAGKSTSKYVELTLRSTTAENPPKIRQFKGGSDTNSYKVLSIHSALAQASLKAIEPTKSIYKFGKSTSKSASVDRFMETTFITRTDGTRTLIMVSPQFTLEYFTPGDSVDESCPQRGRIISGSTPSDDIPKTQVQYDPLNFMNSWAVMSDFGESGERLVDLHFVPVTNYVESVSKLIGEAARIHFAFGFWQGHITTASGRTEFEGLAGMAIKINHD